MRKTSLSIVHLFTHSGVTRGGAVQGLLLARSLQEKGHRVVSFFHAPFGHREKGESISTASPYLPISSPLRRDPDIRRINMKHPLHYLRFFRWLQREQVDVLHAHRNLALLFGYFSSRALSPPPLLVVNRGTTYPLSNPLIKHVFLSDRLNRVIAVAHAVKHSLVETEGVDARKISVVYGSFDENRFHPGLDGTRIREEFNLFPYDPLIACIAAIDSRKGLEFLVQSAVPVLRTFPRATFLLVGNIEDASYYRRVQEEIDRLGLKERVLFTGHRTDVPNILSAADVSVNASTEGEGFTGALRESLAVRKPVVCTAVCGNPELIRDGETGWLVPPRNAPALAEAIVEALSNPQEALRRAQQGYALISRLCTNEERCRQVESIYYSDMMKAG